MLQKKLVEPANAPAPRWPRGCLNCVSGLRRLEKTLNFLRYILVIDLVLKYGSDINEENWLQRLPCFIVLIGIVVPGFGLIFFSSVFQVLDWNFIILLFDGNVCNCIPNKIWSRMDCFGFFVWKMASFVDLISVLTEICKIWSLFILFWRHQVLSILSLRGILVCFLKTLVIFSHMILWYRLISIGKAMQLYPLSFFVFEAIFLGSGGKCLWILLKTNSLFSKFFC